MSAAHLNRSTVLTLAVAAVWLAGCTSAPPRAERYVPPAMGTRL